MVHHRSRCKSRHVYKDCDAHKRPPYWHAHPENDQRKHHDLLHPSLHHGGWPSDNLQARPDLILGISMHWLRQKTPPTERVGSPVLIFLMPDFHLSCEMLPWPTFHSWLSFWTNQPHSRPFSTKTNISFVFDPNCEIPISSEVIYKIILFCILPSFDQNQKKWCSWLVLASVEAWFSSNITRHHRGWSTLERSGAWNNASRFLS